MFEHPDSKTQRLFKKSTRQVLVNSHQWLPKRTPGTRIAKSNHIMVRTDNIREVIMCNDSCFDHNRPIFVQGTNQEALSLGRLATVMQDTATEINCK